MGDFTSAHVSYDSYVKWTLVLYVDEIIAIVANYIHGVFR